MKSINLSRKLVMSKEFTIIGESYAINLPNSLEYADISYFGDLRHSINSINITANNLQFLDSSGTYLLDCNYEWYGLNTFKNFECLVMKNASLWHWVNWFRQTRCLLARVKIIKIH